MALSFQYRSRPASLPDPARVALFPGAWNPPTVAHLAIARAARAWADEIVLVLPRSLPHKAFDGAAFAHRLALLHQLAVTEPDLSVATTDGGLYFEMAAEAERCFGPHAEIGLVCGRDAAERIAAWDYGRPGVFGEMLARHPLLVAARAGDYVAASPHAARIVTLPMNPSFSDVSSTEVRRRIATRDTWRHLVPDAIAGQVEVLYSEFH
ncbi:MAG: hypothetical protein ABUS51_09440 [Acidobacteriota bacterium]